MAVRKIRAGRVSTVTMDEFVGDVGTIFYDEDTGEMRISNGENPGGTVVTTLPIASNVILGGIRIGNGLTIDSNGLVAVTGVSSFGANSEIDGGNASTIYTDEIIVDGGGA